jgi:hypothetical protein
VAQVTDIIMGEYALPQQPGVRTRAVGAVVNYFAIGSGNVSAPRNTGVARLAFRNKVDVIAEGDDNYRAVLAPRG